VDGAYKSVEGQTPDIAEKDKVGRMPPEKQHRSWLRKKFVLWSLAIRSQSYDSARHKQAL
jgi:hypothetical protein